MRSLFDVLNRLPTHTSNPHACVLHPHTHSQSSTADAAVITISLFRGCMHSFRRVISSTGQLVFVVPVSCRNKCGLIQTLHYDSVKPAVAVVTISSSGN